MTCQVELLMVRVSLVTESVAKEENMIDRSIVNPKMRNGQAHIVPTLDRGHMH